MHWCLFIFVKLFIIKLTKIMWRKVRDCFLFNQILSLIIIQERIKMMLVLHQSVKFS